MPSTVNDVRNGFIEYFKTKHNHEYINSSSVIPKDDPTLLFVNSGMVQFKEIFKGNVEPTHSRRVVNTQRCIRAGGKHNDLDDVGRDSYHHTYFEMLGNWSFGDFFKKESIEMAWEFLVDVLCIDKDKLYVSYFKGCEELGIPEDTETKEIWTNIGVSPSKILGFGTKENFWEMGESGPCGGCTEIHYDMIGNRDASSLVNMDDPEVIEIWNLVFMEFNREKTGEITRLPMKHVDTGIGLERLTAVVQGKRTNYSTDVFSPYMELIQSKTDSPQYEDKYGVNDLNGVDMAYRIVADHLRTLVVGLGDGTVFSSDGPGYVLRRVARRGIRYFIDFLNGKRGDFSEMSSVAVDLVGEVFPELLEKKESIKENIRKEEELFLKTLSHGKKQFEKISEEALSNGDEKIEGTKVWRLYETYGFPVDLTRLMATEKGLEVDAEEVAKAETSFKQQSKEKKVGTDGNESCEFSSLDTLGIPKTEDEFKYKEDPINARIVAMFVNKTRMEGITSDNGLCSFIVILDKTNFYSERGGQIGDTGRLLLENGIFTVENTQIGQDIVMHIGKLHGAMALGEEVKCVLDVERRQALRRTHTAVHLFDHFVRKVFGKNMTSDSSNVSPDKARLEINRESLTDKEISEADDYFKALIKFDYSVTTEVMPVEDALKIEGIIALFKGRYPDYVRVVAVESTGCIEICGGTHLKKLSDLMACVIYSDKSISKGKRKIGILTGEKAIFAERTEKEIQDILNADILTNEGLDFVDSLLKTREISLIGRRKFQKEVLNKRKILSKIEKKKRDENHKRMIKLAEELSNTGGRVFRIQEEVTRVEITSMITLFVDKMKEGIFFGKEGKFVNYGIFIRDESERRRVSHCLTSEYGGKNWTSGSCVIGWVDQHNEELLVRGFGDLGLV
eukprot:GHVP01017502.1.p1 GENE.GHVP01017502.1~~GHVP01017502.1.p1  ORF type:complete len:903 (+),score=209.06 GHVP01017502.1:1556-4264(+)